MILANMILSQKDVQRNLELLSSGTLNTPFSELEQWSNSVGYFAHLKQPNEYMTFVDADLGLNLRLQLNYSRLGYKKPDHPDLPACPLCIENVGVPGKELLRVYEFSLLGEQYFAHLTPFPLHPGHFVVNKRTHSPMKVDAHSLAIAAEFIRSTSGFLLASNSDVEWAGASVLDHQHYQVFSNLVLPIQQARGVESGMLKGARWEVLHWPCAAVRFTGGRQTVLELGGELIARWKSLAPGFATANYLMSRVDQHYTLILTLRHPQYRTQAALTELKAEGVGVIEMCGEAILPPRPNLSREENTAFFAERGLKVIREIIAQNSPSPIGLNAAWLARLITNSDPAGLQNPFSAEALN